MQALGLVRIPKKQNLVENSSTKISECKKMRLGRSFSTFTVREARAPQHDEVGGNPSPLKPLGTMLP